MSQFQNLIAYQSGLRNAGSEQRQQQDDRNRSLANMPIYPEEQSTSPLSSFKSRGSSKPRNFSSDLLFQALAAKSNLGLCDSQARSDALQSLRSYGSQSVQDSPSRNNQSVQNPRYQDSLIGQSVPGYLHPALFSQAEGRQDEWFNRGKEEQSVENDQLYHKSIGDSNESFTPFRPPLQLNTVEDEDEFLYGDATPVKETPGEAPKKEVVAGKEGTGSWSDEEIMIIEDLGPEKLHYETPRPKPTKETSSIPLKDLSWKSSTAWKDETVYSQKAEKPQAADSAKATYRRSNRSESQETEVAIAALEKSTSAQTLEKLTSRESMTNYANAAVLLKKQLDVNDLLNSNSPSTEMREQITDLTNVEKGLKSASADSPSKRSPYHHLLINIEQGSNVLKKRVVSLTENSSSGVNISNMNVSPLTVQHDKDIVSKLETRVVRDTYESTRHQESSKIRPSHYLKDYNKSKLDKYSKDLYERKYMHRDRSPESPRRISPGSYRYRSPSVEHRRRDRSSSPGYRFRHRSRPRLPEERSRSRPRLPEERSREKSPRFRHRSRGRSPSYHYEDRPRRDKSCDRRISNKRQHSPDDSPRLVGKRGTLTSTSKKEALERHKPVPPSVEETLSAESPESSSRLFPKSMSPDMAALFMKKSEVPKQLIKSKMEEQHSDPILDSADEEIVVQKLNFTLMQVQQSELLNELVAQMQVEEENKKVSILAQKVELALDANTRRFEMQSAAVYPPTNTFPQAPSAMPYSSMEMYPPSAQMPQAPPSQTYPYSYPASTPAPFPTSYPYSQPYPPSSTYIQGPPSTYSQVQSTTYSQSQLPVYGQDQPPEYSQRPLPTSPPSKLANVAPPTPSRWLRSVPVLSAEEMSKAKESEAELMSQYCRRVEERDLSHKKLTNLSNQVTELQKMKNDFEKRSKKVRRGTDSQFIAEFQSLKEKASMEHKQELQELKRLNNEVLDLEKKIKPTNLIKCQDNMKKAQEEKKPSEVYGCFDTGKHFCVQCSMRFPSIMEIIQHLHTPEHMQREDLTKGVASKKPPTIEAKVTTLHPVKGLEFVNPVNAFYCSLCEEILLNPLFAEQHLKGHDHTVKYINFLQENPMYEEKRKLMVHARTSVITKENRLKELQDAEKAQQLFLKKKHESAEKLQKLQSRLQGEQLREGKVQELDEMETAKEPLQKKAAIRVNLTEKEKAMVEKEKAKEPTPKKPKQQVIYIGRAPNFKPKEKVLKDKEVKEEEKTVKEKLVKNQEEKRLSKSVSGSSVPNKECGSTLSVSKTPVGKTVNLPNENRKRIESPGSRNDGSRRDQDLSKKEDVPIDKKKEGASAKVKVFGCQSEAEAKSVQGDRKRETESKTSQKKEPKTVQLQMNEPNTDDPAVNKALKNILYGSKSKTPGLDSNLSAIKLPEDPPLPPPPDKVIVKPKLQERKILTEEEKDFILLGINKSDMEPIAIPRPPPSTLLKVRVSSPTNSLKAANSPSNKTIPTSSKITQSDVTVPKIAQSNVAVPISPKIALPNITVPPPNLQVPLPSIQVPLPNLTVPPPNLQVPLHNLQIPPPTLQVHMPNLQVPPPNMLLNNPPVRHGPYGQAYNTHAHFHSTGYPQLHFNYKEIVDMDIDYEGETEIPVGTQRSNTAIDVPNPIERRSGYSSIPTKSQVLQISKPTRVPPNKSGPKSEVLQTSKPGHYDSNDILNKRNAPDGLKITTEPEIGSKEDRLICANVLNSIIKTVLAKHRENSSEDLNTRSSTYTSNVNESEVIVNFTHLKSPKGVSSKLDPIFSSVSTDSTICHKAPVHTDNASQIVDTEEIAKSEGTLSSLHATNVDTFDFPPKVIDLQFTNKVSLDKSELNSNSINANINTETLESEKHQESDTPNAKNISIDSTELNSESISSNINTETPETKKHQELETPTAKYLMVCNPKASSIISDQEDLSLLTQSFDVQETDKLEVSNIKEATEVNTSQFDIDKKENNALESKENDPLYVETKNINELISEENIHSVISSHENPIILQEKSLSSIEVPKTPENFSTLENKSEHINLINYLEISESPLIHGIEHFMDTKVDNQPAETSLSAEEFPNNLSFKQQTVMSMKDENAGNLPISISNKNSQIISTEVVEGSSAEFCVSGLEKMDVEETDIPISTEDNLQNTFVVIKNAHALDTEINLLGTSASEEEKIYVEENMLIAQSEEADAQTVNNLQDSCISGTRNFDEAHQVSSSGLDLDCSEETTIDKNLLVANIKLSSKSPEENLEEMEPLQTCKSSKNEEHQNSLSCLGLGCSEESKINKDLLVASTKLSSKSPEENLEMMEPLETYNSVSRSVLEDHLKTVQCSIDIESECENENAIGKESTIKFPLYEVYPLDKEYSAQNIHSTEVENLDEIKVHIEDKEKKVENEFSVTDIPGDLQKAENPITENFGKLATSDLFSESVLSPGIKVTEHAIQDKKTTDETIVEDMGFKGNSEVNSPVPCLEKFDLEDSLSNSLSDNPPVLSEEEKMKENEGKLTKEKKQDSDTDEYENEGGKE